MKRGPTWDERALIHVTLNTNDAQAFALVRENYDPVFLARLQESLPKIPGFSGWEIVRSESQAAGVRQFDMRIGGKTFSNNRVECTGNTLVLWTVRLAPAGDLSSEEAAIVADLEQCGALAVLGFAT